MSRTIINRILRAALIGGTAISALAIAQPAMAYTELGTTGTVGKHSLSDTEVNPGATCRYDFSSANGAFKLKHISVLAPGMRAVPGMGIEKVAWSFTVQRRIISFGGVEPWDDRYTSPKFKSSTDSHHHAQFDQGSEGVKVVVPYQAGADASAEYRVIVNLFWYKTDGTTVLGTATDRVDWYYPDQSNGHTFFQKFCPDYD